MKNLTTTRILVAGLLLLVTLLAIDGAIYRNTWHPVANAINSINLGDQPVAGKV